MTFAEIEEQYGIDLDETPGRFYCEDCETFHDEDAFADVNVTPLVCRAAAEALKPVRPFNLNEFKALGGCVISLHSSTKKSFRTA